VIGVQEEDLSRDGRSDRELLEACGEDLAAFGELIRRHQDFVYGAVLRVLRNPTLAEDVTQEAFLRAYRAREGFRGDAAVRSWLYRIGTNLALNAVTRRKEYPRETLPEPDPAEGALHHIEREELREQVRAAVESLPQKLRAPLVLREWEELSYQEIADRLGLRLNTVRTRILRARRSVKQKLEGEL
jgi:RNA polymerase sigma-70 factor (ECF subfamily)